MSMEAKGVLGLVQRVACSRVGVLGIGLAAMYTGYAEHETLRRIEQNLVYKNTPVAEGYFKDPVGLCVQTELNTQGVLEVYLVHSSGKRQAIHQDWLPDTKSVLITLAKRMSVEQGSAGKNCDYNKCDSARQLLPQNTTAEKGE